MNRRTRAVRWLLLLVLMAVLLAILMFYVDLRRDRAQAALENMHTRVVQVAWDSAVDMHRHLVRVYFDEYVQDSLTLALLRAALDPDQRVWARTMLYRHLHEPYQRMQKDRLRQLHFHLPGGDSLLRFHKPELSGDNLWQVRRSIAQVNERLEPVTGFEIGRIVSGFRHVFPVFGENEFLGTVELSMSFDAIRQRMAELLPEREFQFVLRADLVDDVLFEQQQALYAPWRGAPGLVIEDPGRILPDAPPPLTDDMADITTRLRDSRQFQQLVSQRRSGTLPVKHEGHWHLITLTSVDDVQGAVAGFVVSARPAPEMAAIQMNYRLSLMSAGLGVLVILALSALLLRKHEQLALGHDRMQTIAATMGDGLYVLDVQGRIEQINPQACQLLGYASDAPLLGHCAHELFHSHEANDFLAPDRCPIVHAVRSGDEFRGLEQFRRADGSLFTARVVSRPLYERGRFIGSVTSFADISRAIRNQQQVQENEQLLQAMFNAIQDGICVLDENLRVIRANRAMEQFCGEPSSCLGQYCYKAFHNRQSECPWCPAVKAFSSGALVRETIGVPEENPERWLELTAYPICDEDGAVQGIVEYIKDVTQVRKHQQVLEDFNSLLAERVSQEVEQRTRTEQVYQTLFESTPDGLLLMDTSGKFLECNPAAAQMVGLVRDQILGRTPAELATADRPTDTDLSTEDFVDHVIVRALSGELCEFEWMHIKPTDALDAVLAQDDESTEEQAVLLDVSVLALDADLFADRRLLVMMRDITRERELEREHQAQNLALMQQSKMAEIGGMMGAIAHQWKQPLNAIALHVQLMSDLSSNGELSAEEVTEMEGEVMSLVDFMCETIDDFRNFFRPSDKAELFDVCQVTHAVMAIMKGQLMKHQIEIDINACKRDGLTRIEVMGIASEFQHVILNLLSNCRDVLIEKRESDRRIQLVVERDEDWCELRICDNGGGIPEDLLPDRIFEPFVSTKGSQGTGIGLSLARSILLKMHGTIDAYNQGEGACFRVRIPLMVHPYVPSGSR